MALVDDLVAIEQAIVSAAEKTAEGAVDAAAGLLHEAAELVKSTIEKVGGK